MHVPPRFRHNRAAWYARKLIVATRRAAAAHAEGRTAWADRWHLAARINREAWLEIRED